MKINKLIVLIGVATITLIGCDQETTSKEEAISFADFALPTFSHVSVHDPSVVKVEDTYYVFGSHMASAKSDDLMNWTQLTTSVKDANVIFGEVTEKFEEAMTWAETDTFWAPDAIQLADGRYYFYYNTCRGDSPLSALGLAVADTIEGPYEDLGVFLKSGMWGQESPAGTVYDATVHPNVVDPSVFFDQEGRLWMMYGSYSGGIYILEMNTETGFPLKGQGYGKKILGGNHLRIEAPYVMYSPESDYYYLFLSFGGLGADGGYNIRVARSKNPDGPYEDANGLDMIKCKGKNGAFFDDSMASAFGAKLMGNFQFNHVDGESGKKITSGYVSPGHNSTYYNEETDEYYMIFHTRFTLRGEQHEVRVHQMYLNEDDWFVIAPHPYTAQEQLDYSEVDVSGDYKFINHDKDITAQVKVSSLVTLNPDHTISGAVEGTWSYDRHQKYLNLTIDDVTYKGVVSHQWNEDTQCYVMTFSAMSDYGITVWGSKVAISPANEE